MRGALLWVLLTVLFCAVAGVWGCNRRSSTTTTTPRPPPPPEVVEEEIIAVTAAPDVDRGNNRGWETVGGRRGGNSGGGRRGGSNSGGGNRGGSGNRGGGGGNRSGGSRNDVSNNELQELSENLLRVDSGLSQPTLSYQGKTSSTSTADNAQNRLISSVPQTALDSQTVQLMSRLLDNYDPNTNVAEQQTNGERAEEQAFLDAVIGTPVMRSLDTFLTQKNLLTGSGGLRRTLEDIWFTLYKRGGRYPSSSGFEHVFVGEVRGNKVSGFHNWVYFMKEEVEGDLDYKGYMKTVDLNGKGSIAKVRFVWMGEAKPVGSMFVGTTPELEMALYTVCFLTRPDSRCHLKLAGNRVQIQTWTINNRGKKVIGSAYPEI